MSEILSKYNWVSVAVFVLLIVVAHFYSSPAYDWKNNTISELASQHYDQRWIMKTGFILFGTFLSAGILVKLLGHKGDLLIELPILIYALSILVSGIFSTKPFESGVEYSEVEYQIHSICAQLAGFTFTIGLLTSGIKEANLSLRLIHLAFFVFVLACSILFGLMKENMGIVQRIMYLGSFVWLLGFYNCEE